MTDQLGASDAALRAQALGEGPLSRAALRLRKTSRQIPAMPDAVPRDPGAGSFGALASPVERPIGLGGGDSAAAEDEAAKRWAGGRHELGPTRAPAPKGSALGRLLKDAAFVVVSAVILSFLLKTFLIQSFYIPSESMEPTLMAGDSAAGTGNNPDRVVVTKLAPGLLDVHRGDIVVFRDPGGWVNQTEPTRQTGPISSALRQVAQAIGLAPADSEGFLIKRVIGLGGDRVACEGSGRPVTVNGVPLDETYVAPGAAPSVEAFDVVVPQGALWVMGDNRAKSADSRAHRDGALGGAVSLDLVVGVAQLRTWPISRFGLLRNPGSVFATVPNLNGG
ncbi:MAG: signal peptidase I [Bifidobacteriaceae bacterium]|nr:signal peptidase I [Bifidobacteriaceae bacterium]